MSAPNQLSFLPDDYLERKARRRTNLVLAVLFCLVAGAIGTGFSYTTKALGEARRENELTGAEHAAAARMIQQFQQLQEKQRTMNQQAELAASLLEKVPRSKLLAEYTEACADTGVSLLDIVMESRVRSVAAQESAFEKKKAEAKAKKSGGAAATPAVPQPKAADVTIKLTGVANTDIQVAQFITKLNASDILRDVNLVLSEEYKHEDQVLRRFQLEMMIDPTAKLAPGQTSDDDDTKTAAVELK